MRLGMSTCSDKLPASASGSRLASCNFVRSECSSAHYERLVLVVADNSFMSHYLNPCLKAVDWNDMKRPIKKKKNTKFTRDVPIRY